MHLLLLNRKLALPWQQDEDARLRWDFKDKQAKLVARFVRKDVSGSLVAEVRQIGTSAEWTAVDLAPAGRAPEKARTAPSVWEALIDADAHLEASDWRLLALSFWLATTTTRSSGAPRPTYRLSPSAYRLPPNSRARSARTPARLTAR